MVITVTSYDNIVMLLPFLFHLKSLVDELLMRVVIVILEVHLPWVITFFHTLRTEVIILGSKCLGLTHLGG